MGASFKTVGTFSNQGKVQVLPGLQNGLPAAAIYADEFDNFGTLDLSGDASNMLQLHSSFGAPGMGNYVQEAAGSLVMKIDWAVMGSYNVFVIDGTGTYNGNFTLQVGPNAPLAGVWGMVKNQVTVNPGRFSNQNLPPG